MVNPLTCRDHELLSMYFLPSYFQVIFDNGAAWASLEGQCRGCGRPVPESRLRGLVVRANLRGHGQGINVVHHHNSKNNRDDLNAEPSMRAFLNHKIGAVMPNRKTWQ